MIPEFDSWESTVEDARDATTSEREIEVHLQDEKSHQLWMDETRKVARYCGDGELESSWLSDEIATMEGLYTNSGGLSFWWSHPS